MKDHSWCPVCEGGVRYQRFSRDALPCPHCGAWLKAVHECDMGGCLEYLVLANDQGERIARSG